MVQVIDDPCFPDIHKALDVSYIKALLQLRLFNDQGSAASSITACEVGEKRYKPGKSFQLSYDLTILDSSTGVSQELVLTARLSPAGRNGDAACEEDYPDNNSKLPAGIRPVTYIPEVNAVFRVFPFDPKLLHLPKLQDADYLVAYFKRNPAIIRLKNDEKITGIAKKVMHYLPGQSCMTRYALTIASPETGGVMIIYGKSYKDDSGAEVFSIMRQLSGQIENSAKPLYYDDQITTLWQLHSAGVPFAWNQGGYNLNRRLLTTVAKAIAAFHSSKLVTTRYFRMMDIINQLNASCEIAPMAGSAISQRIKEAIHQILHAYKHVDWTEKLQAPMHLDLKMGNMLISEDRVVLIDMDSVCLGDPLADFGSFIANIYLNGICSGTKVSEIEPITVLLIAEYRSAVSFQVDSQKLNWYIAAALIHEVVRRSLRQQSHSRLRHLEDFIGLARRYCAHCRAPVGNAACMEV